MKHTCNKDSVTPALDDSQLGNAHKMSRGGIQEELRTQGLQVYSKIFNLESKRRKEVDDIDYCKYGESFNLFINLKSAKLKSCA